MEMIILKWKDVRKLYPKQWVLIEAIQAITNENSERNLEEVLHLKQFSNSSDAMKTYKFFHLDNPTR
jgi:hypothetical protein